MYIKIENVSNAAWVLPILRAGRKQFNPGDCIIELESDLTPVYPAILDACKFVDGEVQVPAFVLNKSEERADLDGTDIAPKITDEATVIIGDTKVVELEPELPATVEVSESPEDLNTDSKVDPAEDTDEYSREDLEGMGMKELRAVGTTYGVRDNKHADLVDKILDAQSAE